MTTGFAVLLVLHGLIHLLGAAKAFGWATLSQLREPIAVGTGGLWLAAAILFIAAAGSLYWWPRGWWAVGAVAVAASIAAILPSWSGAKFGLIPNAIITVAVVFGFLSQGPFSLRAEYDRDVQSRSRRRVSLERVTDADLAALPDAVQRYLRMTGVIGQPRVHDFRVRMHGRIRNGPDGRWMPFAAEQYNVIDTPARLFYLTASMFLIPVQGYHRYVGANATMRVKAAAVIPVARASGDEMTRAETVTLFNDMCIMAPATLIGAGITWQPVDAHRVKASFANGRHVVRAELWFGDSGELTNFVSDDRYQASPDGETLRRMKWSTPVHGYRSFGASRLAGAGEGRWHDSHREYAYIDLTLDDVQYNVLDLEDSESTRPREQ
jgi:hypothetical protein